VSDLESGLLEVPEDSSLIVDLVASAIGLASAGIVGLITGKLPTAMSAILPVAAAHPHNAIGPAPTGPSQTARIISTVAQGLQATVAGGKLGTSPDQAENLTRLKHIAEKAKAPHEAGELALVPALYPAVLAAHAVKHGNAKVDKAGSTLERQGDSKELVAARKASRTMIQRVKNFIKSFDASENIDDYGFGVPLPERRPRLVKGEPPQPTPNPTP